MENNYIFQGQNVSLALFNFVRIANPMLVHLVLKGFIYPTIIPYVHPVLVPVKDVRTLKPVRDVHQDIILLQIKLVHPAFNFVKHAQMG